MHLITFIFFNNITYELLILHHYFLHFPQLPFCLYLFVNYQDHHHYLHQHFITYCKNNLAFLFFVVCFNFSKVKNHIHLQENYIKTIANNIKRIQYQISFSNFLDFPPNHYLPLILLNHF